MKIVIQNVIWLLAFAAYNYRCLPQNEGTDSIKIAAFFHEQNVEEEIALRNVIFRERHNEHIMRYYSNYTEIISHSDSFATSKTVCNLIGSGDGVGAIIGASSITTDAIVQSMCSKFNIPHLGINWHPYTPTPQTPPGRNNTVLLNFYPKPEYLAQALGVIVKALNWKSFIVLYENDEGLIRLQDILKIHAFTTEKDKRRRYTMSVKQLGPGPDYRALLKDIKKDRESNIIIDCATEKLIKIFRQAKDLDMMDFFYKYFITSLDAHTLDFESLEPYEANITTVRIIDTQDPDYLGRIRNFEASEYNRISLDPNKTKTSTALMHDAVQLFVESVNALSYTDEIFTQPIKCESDDIMQKGKSIVSYMMLKKRPSVSLTGDMDFDDYGQRIMFNVSLVQIANHTHSSFLGYWTPLVPERLVGAKSEIDTNTAAASALKDLKEVIVMTRFGQPYCMERKGEEGEEVPEERRYYGYSIDLMKAIEKELGANNFKFKIVEDGQIGRFDEETQQWNGLIREIVEKRAHLAICDLTITHQRREAVDFSMPFMNLGISILYQKAPAKDVNMFAFLDPFSNEVWVNTVTLYLGMTIVLYFVYRMAPEDWENPHPCDPNPEELENIWDIKNCLWLTLGSIMTQGCDILPKGVSSRMATSMWWFFSLIMTSSYTANLAAFLTRGREDNTIDSVEDLAKQTKIKYGCMKDGSTMAFFKESNFSTYQRMWTNMLDTKPSVFAKDNSDGVHRVQSAKKGSYAFLMESTQIEYEIETKCDLQQVGGLLDSKFYGIAMPIDASYIGSIDKAVLHLQETGKLNELKNKWWKLERTETRCSELEEPITSDQNSLALENVGGVFLVLGVGVGIAYLIGVFEFLWNIRKISVEEHLTYWEALKIEVKFAVNVWITKKRAKPLVSESSSSSSNSGEDAKSIAHNILRNAGSLLNLSNKFRDHVSVQE